MKIFLKILMFGLSFGLQLMTLPGVFEGSVTDSLCFTNEKYAPTRARTKDGQINTPLRSYSQVRMMIYIWAHGPIPERTKCPFSEI